MVKKTPTRHRRLNRALDDMPGLFDLDETPGPIAVADIAPPPPRIEGAGLDLDPEVLERPQAIRFISFGSGSSGNCAYIGNDNGALLIDAGIDHKIVEKAMERNHLDWSRVAGIVLTHDHGDHTRYAYTLLRDHRHMRLFCTPRVLGGILKRHSISRRIQDYHKPIYKEHPFQAGGFTVTAFDTSHDGTDNAGFALALGPRTFVVATDMGMYTDRANYYMELADYMMLEANYDLDMLRRGPRPEYLKARIIGTRGHTDNTVAAARAAQLAAGRLRYAFLCHLSDDNNTPEIALTAVRTAVKGAGLTVVDAIASPVAQPGESPRLRLTALPRYDASPLFILR